jgi:NADH-quinone oxidoreductase subunit N
MVLLFSSQLLFQNNLKKIVGCTIMNYVGNTLLCCAFPCYNSASSIMFSSASAVASLLGIFFLLDGVKKSKVQQIENISHLNSLAYSNPLFATSVSLLFLSLFGFPPFLGFWGKFYVCSAMIGKNWTLAIYAATLISNLICIAKILDAIWFRKNKETFIFAENTVESVNLMAFLMIIAIPAVCKILQLMNAELYFA